MPLGPPPPPKGGLDDPPLDPGGLSNRKNEEVHEGPNIFNSQMGPMGLSLIYLFFYLFPLRVHEATLFCFLNLLFSLSLFLKCYDLFLFQVTR